MVDETLTNLSTDFRDPALTRTAVPKLRSWRRRRLVEDDFWRFEKGTLGWSWRTPFSALVKMTLNFVV